VAASPERNKKNERAHLVYALCYERTHVCAHWYVHVVRYV
jgi:hypothetical protein